MSRYTKLTDGAMITNLDESGDTKYYSYVRPDGSWVIMQSSSSGTVFKYAIGNKDYSTRWTNRASLNYKFAYEYPEL